MSSLSRTLTRTTLPILIVVCLAALSLSYAFAEGDARPLATQVIGDPDAAVTGKLAVGTATPGNKALTVVGVIDFLGAGTVHNYFTQGAGNNLQINTNVDEANTIGDTSKSQWKLVMGSSLDWFSIRRSPSGGAYNEDALFFIEGSTGRVGIATVDTSNGGVIPFSPTARLHVQTDSGRAIYGRTTATSGDHATGVLGQSDHPEGGGVVGIASDTTGVNYGVAGESDSSAGYGVYGIAAATTGTNYGVYGASASPTGYGLYTPDNAYVGGKLTVGSLAGQAITGGGIIESSVGGFKFPDGTTQTSVAPKGVVFALCNALGTSEVYRSQNNVNTTAISVATVGGSGTGVCTVDFGFQVDDRFILASTQHPTTALGVTLLSSSGSTATFMVWHGGNGVAAGGPIMVMVY